MMPVPMPSQVPFDVCNLFEELTLSLIRTGHDHYSARAVLHRIRWHHHVDIGNRDFKCNNNWTPDLARWFHRRYPLYKDFFFTRTSSRHQP